jgi:cation diffusion facilitator CzcD-associated flavoprotein CzcO
MFHIQRRQESGTRKALIRLELTFAPNPRWSEYYAPGSEIRAYYEDVVEKYGVKPHLRLRHQVTRATWVEELAQWSVEVLNLTTGETFTETAHFFVSAAGRLNVPKMPDDKQIPGIRTEFKGHYCHTAGWDTDYDWKGKRIAIIGNGASGQQLLSNMVKDAGHIDHYVRSKQWILPAFSTSLPTATADAPGGHIFSEDEKTKFEQDEKAYLAFRQELESNLHGGLRHFLTGSAENESLREKCTETMLKRLNGDKEWFERLKPDYAPGCKRLTPSPGYLEAVTSSKVEYIDQPIVRATSNGLVTADGKAREVDAVIAATGFQNGFLPWFPTIGKNGVDLRERWASDGPIGYPETYFGVMAPDMPNYFAVMQVGLLHINTLLILSVCRID